MGTTNTSKAILGQEQAILNMQAVHGDKYDYSRFVFKTTKIKGEIICQLHGSFLQDYRHHVYDKADCPKCARENQSKKMKGRRAPNSLGRDGMIVRMQQKHKDRFNYSRFDAKNSHALGIIVCPKHGEFMMSMIKHIASPTGCPHCSYRQRGPVRLTLQEVISRAKDIHGNEYEYPQQEYNNSKQLLQIICKKHGIFNQSYNGHVHDKQGCPQCYGTPKRTFEEFLQKAKEAHGDEYEYPDNQYVNNYTPIGINCRIHGTFKQAPFKHINSKQGCPRCKMRSPSKIETRWLNSLSVPDDLTHRQVRISNTFWIADALHENIVYEFYGSYWHGDPRKFSPDSINNHNRRHMGSLYLETLERQQKIKDLGYELKFVWEIDYMDGKLLSACNPHEGMM